MKKLNETAKAILATTAAVALGGFTLTSCEVEKTQEGEMPEVDVEVEGGQLPKYDVDAPEVDVKMEEKEIAVPDVDVKMEEKTIKVPDVDITPPDEDNDTPGEEEVPPADAEEETPQ